MDNIPDGYKLDGQGRLIPVDTIKPIDLARDSLVRDIVTKAKLVSANLADFKNQTFGDIQAFVELSAEQYGTKVGGNKGNVTLMSFDGRYKVQRACQEHISFDERLQAAKALIDQCLTDWTSNASHEIRVLIDRAFEVNKEGHLNTGRILALRRVDIKDPRWLKAMDAISDSIQVVGSKSYVRVYERQGDTDQYTPISLDIAAIS